MIQNRNNRVLRVGQLRWQRGMALVVSLILLIAVTLVGLAGIRGTILQERMAGGAYDRETGFQAAEAALVLGAKDLISNRATWDGEIASHAALDCSNQTCAPNPSDDSSVDGFWKSVPAGVAEEQFSAMDSSNRPQYVVQLLGPCSPAGTGTGYTG